MYILSQPGAVTGDKFHPSPFKITNSFPKISSSVQAPSVTYANSAILGGYISSTYKKIISYSFENVQLINAKKKRQKMYKPWQL